MQRMHLQKADGTSETVEAKKISSLLQVLNLLIYLFTIDKERIHFYFEALKLEFPKHLVIIWWRSYWYRARSSLFTSWSASLVVEYMDRIIPGMDSSLSKELTKY
jgi:dihydrolipoamide dehydrogenase